MTLSESVAENIYKEAVETNNEIHGRNLLNGDPEKSIKTYAKAMLLFRRLKKEDQDTFVEFLKLVSVDAVSVLLGGIDGSTDLGKLEGEFVLKYDGEEIQGNLQNDFFDVVERKSLVLR